MHFSNSKIIFMLLAAASSSFFAPCSAVPFRGSGPFVLSTPVASFGNDCGDTGSGSAILGETTFSFHAAIEGRGFVLSPASHIRSIRADGSGRFAWSSLPTLNSSFGNDGDTGSGSAVLGEVFQAGSTPIFAILDAWAKAPPGTPTALTGTGTPTGTPITVPTGTPTGTPTTGSNLDPATSAVAFWHPFTRVPVRGGTEPTQVDDGGTADDAVGVGLSSAETLADAATDVGVESTDPLGILKSIFGHGCGGDGGGCCHRGGGIVIPPPRDSSTFLPKGVCGLAFTSEVPGGESINSIAQASSPSTEAGWVGNVLSAIVLLCIVTFLTGRKSLLCVHMQWKSAKISDTSLTKNVLGLYRASNIDRGGNQRRVSCRSLRRFLPAMVSLGLLLASAPVPAGAASTDMTASSMPMTMESHNVRGLVNSNARNVAQFSLFERKKKLKSFRNEYLPIFFAVEKTASLTCLLIDNPAFQSLMKNISFLVKEVVVWVKTFLQDIQDDFQAGNSVGKTTCKRILSAVFDLDSTDQTPDGGIDLSSFLQFSLPSLFDRRLASAQSPVSSFWVDVAMNPTSEEDEIFGSVSSLHDAVQDIGIKLDALTNDFGEMAPHLRSSMDGATPQTGSVDENLNEPDDFVRLKEGIVQLFNGVVKDADLNDSTGGIANTAAATSSRLRGTDRTDQPIPELSSVLNDMVNNLRKDLLDATAGMFHKLDPQQEMNLARIFEKRLDGALSSGIRAIADGVREVRQDGVDISEAIARGINVAVSELTTLFVDSADLIRASVESTSGDIHRTVSGKKGHRELIFGDTFDVAGAIGELKDAISSLQDVPGTVTDLVNKVDEIAQKLLNVNLGELLTQVNNIAVKVVDIADALPTNFDEAMAELGKISEIGADLQKIPDAIGAVKDEIIGGIKDFTQTTIDSATDEIGDIVDAAANTITNEITDLARAFDKVLRSLLENVKKGFEAVPHVITGGVVNTLCGLGSSKIANTPFVSGIDYVAKVLFENFDGQIGTIFDYFYSVLDDLSGDSLGEMGSILCRPPTGLVHVLANLKEVIEDTMAPGNEKDIEYGAGLEARQFICDAFRDSKHGIFKYSQDLQHLATWLKWLNDEVKEKAIPKCAGAPYTGIPETCAAVATKMKWITSSLGTSLEWTKNNTKNVLSLREKDSFKFLCPPCGPSNEQVPYVPGTGCDKIDQDCNLLVDDCLEDTFPPTISLKEEIGGRTFLDDQRAQEWLLTHVVTSDDCAELLQTSVVLHDSTQPGKNTYKVTTTDPRCSSSESETASTTTFFTLNICSESLNEFLIGSGCDGIDQNCNGLIDDCGEDRSPPKIIFDKAAIHSKPFRSQEDAMEFLDCHVSVEDDCSTTLKYTIERIVEKTAGITNIYRVTAVDERCSNEDEETAFSTSTLDIEVKIDEEAPTISCGFAIPQDPVFDTEFDPKGDSFRYAKASTDEKVGETLVLNPDRFKKKLVDTKFWYDILDNSNGNVEVSVEVLSNEAELDKGQEPLAKLAQIQNGSTTKAMAFVELDECKAADDTCLSDEIIGARFFQVRVRAVDSAGNGSTCVGNIAVVPEDPNSPYRSSLLDADEVRQWFKTAAESFDLDLGLGETAPTPDLMDPTKFRFSDMGGLREDKKTEGIFSHNGN